MHPDAPRNSETVKEVISLIFQAVNLKSIDPNTVQESTKLVGEGLGLDSIDLLEIILFIEEKYGFKITNSKISKEVFSDIGTLTDYIQVNKKV